MRGYSPEIHLVSRRDALLGLGGAAVYLSTRALGDADSALKVSGIPVDVVLTALSNTILRLSLVPAWLERAAVKEINDDPVLALSSQGQLLMKGQSAGSSQVLTWDNRRLRVTGSPITIEIEHENGELIQSLRVDDQGTVIFKSSRAPVFGLGEGGPQFDRRGQQYTMENGQLAPFLDTIGARLPIPWLISADGWALFFHEPFGVLDLSGPEYVFSQSPTAVENPVPLDIFFVASEEPAEIMKANAQITGFPHMPPLWALGYQQSHRTLSSRQEILEEAKKFRDEELPCDAMIYLGTGFCPSGWNTGHGSFTFNKKVFPDPKQIIQELHNEHFHVVLHLTRPPQHLHGLVTDTGAVAEDFSDAAHFWATHLDVFRLGVDGWWADEGDPLCAEARLARNRMYWEGPLKERPDKRPFALHRNGYAGMQRYGWLWSGDVDCTWQTLRAQIAVGLNTGLTGLPFWGTDTGGFVPTKQLTGELYVRWFQFSAFSPLFRSHGRTWKLRLPWGWNTGEFGPAEVDASRMPDATELHNAQVEPICQKYLNLRYRLLPYTYSAVHAAHETGLPLMRALWLHYPADPKAVCASDEYLWGSDMLIAPVTEPGAASKQVYLPEGVWYDFWTGQRTEGEKTVDRPVDLATIPIYVRGGAVLPLGPVKQYVNEKSDEPITLRVHPGASGRSFIYADDGESLAYEHGDFMQLSLKWNDASHLLTVELAPGSKRVWPEFNKIQVELPRRGELKRINFDGKPVVIQL
jgi:alpha-glucosidase (family GH31 glycosyl hydrolase)